MTHRFPLVRSSLVAVSLLAASLQAAARVHPDPRDATSGPALPLTEAMAQANEVARASMADGTVMASVNGAPFFAPNAYAFESVFPIDQKVYFVIRHGKTPRETGLILSIPVKDGETHVGDGRYEFHVVPPELAAPRMGHSERIPAPPGYHGFAMYEAVSGWVDLKFNIDRTHVDATFEFDAEVKPGEPGRSVRRGTFSVPNFDLSRTLSVEQVAEPR